MEAITTFRDAVLRTDMKEIEAKIVILLTKKSGEWVIPQHQHYCAGLAGALGKKSQNLSNILAGMVSLGWITSYQEEHGRKTFYKCTSKDVVKKAMKILNIEADPPSLIDCEVCGTNYSSLMKGCPTCAKNEAEYLLQAKAKDPKRTKTGKVIQTTKITHAPRVGYKKPRDSSTEKFIVEEKTSKTKQGLKELPEKKTPKQLIGGATGETKLAGLDPHEISAKPQDKVSIPRDGSESPPTRAAELNAQSEKSREQKTKGAREFGEWCKIQEFTDIETMALHLLVTDDGNYLCDEQFWPGRVMCLQNENQTELSKLFKNNLKVEYVRAQLMDAAKDIWGRYENEGRA